MQGIFFFCLLPPPRIVHHPQLLCASITAMALRPSLPSAVSFVSLSFVVHGIVVRVLLVEASRDIS